MKKEEIYISVDIESDGPIPGEYSMLSLGAAAFSKNKKLISTYQSNFDLLENAKQDPSTMDWWKTQPKAWEECRKNTRSASVIMPEFANWLKSLHGIPVFVGYPAGYDFTFVYWYLIKFNGSSPFSFSAIDIKTYAMALMKTSYRDSTKKNMPKNWFPSHPHTHVALDDAIEQGLLFLLLVF